MNTLFEFATSGRIIFGNGRLDTLPELVEPFGQKVLVFTSIGRILADRVQTLLDTVGIDCSVYEVKSEPSIELVEHATQYYREQHCEFVISIGGGSVIDTGKAVSAMITNPGNPLDYLEVIGKGEKLKFAPVPFVAIPTTAGTGAEVTRNAVLASKQNQVKVSLRSPMMIPKIALVDPELTYTVPKAVTASTGMDALTQVIEPFLSIKATIMTDLFCREGIKRASRSLKTAYYEPTNRAAREDMAMTSLLGGLALANSKLGAVHGFAGVLGGMYSAPHGAICARLLAPTMQINQRAIMSRDSQNPIAKRFKEIARIIRDDQSATAEDGILWISEISDELNLVSLRNYGVNESDFPEIISRSKKSSSMKGNPIELTSIELEEILHLAF